jgi:hypothetical protein
VLTPTRKIHADIYWIATNNIKVVQPQNLLVKAHVKEKVLNEARPACASFISWRFSRVDAMLWISNATAKLPLPDLPFEGYIQSTDAIDLPRLHRSMQDAIWEPVSGNLFQSTAYQQFSSANNAFEYDNDGSPALSQVVARLQLVLAEGGLGCVWTRGWSGFRSKKSAFKSSDSSHL